MNRDRKPFDSGLLFACAFGFTCPGLWCCSANKAEGRGKSGGNQQQAQMMQGQAQQNAQIAEAQKKKDQEIMSRFDLNGNGKIGSSEKPAWDKFWRDVRTGKTEHPYSSLDLNSKGANGLNDNSKKKK